MVGEDIYQLLAKEQSTRQPSSLELSMRESLDEADKEIKKIKDLYESGIDKPEQVWYGSTFKKEEGSADTHKRAAIKALTMALDFADEASLTNKVAEIKNAISVAKSL